VRDEDTEEMKKSLGRLRHRWENIIEIDCTETVCEDVDWINLIQDRVHW
jgi:hypothetical protein